MEAVLYQQLKRNKASVQSVTTPLAGRWVDEGCNSVLVCKLGGFPGET